MKCLNYVVKYIEDFRNPFHHLIIM